MIDRDDGPARDVARERDRARRGCAQRGRVSEIDAAMPRAVGVGRRDERSDDPHLVDGPDPSAGRQIVCGCGAADDDDEKHCQERQDRRAHASSVARVPAGRSVLAGGPGTHVNGHARGRSRPVC